MLPTNNEILAMEEVTFQEKRELHALMRKRFQTDCEAFEYRQGAEEFRILEVTMLAYQHISNLRTSNLDELNTVIERRAKYGRN